MTSPIVQVFKYTHIDGVFTLHADGSISHLTLQPVTLRDGPDLMVDRDHWIATVNPVEIVQ